MGLISKILPFAVFGISNSMSVCALDASDNRPNILFAIADDVTFLHMSAYGCKWISTPAFDYVAKQGILFNNAYTCNAKSAPSRSSILTGRNSWQLEEAANHMCFFPVKFATFPEVLSENGYHVGYTGKGWSPGIARTAEGKERELLVKSYRKNKHVPPTFEVSNDDYAKDFELFLNEKKHNEPFFFWYGGWEPHRAYEYGSGLKNGKMLSEIDEVFAFWPDVDSVRMDLLDYAYELEYFDMQLDKMIKILKNNGLLNNTIIVVTSDNGMPFPRIKGQQYELSNHLPLAIMWPNGIKQPGRVVEDFISFIDFAPTLLQVAEIHANKTKMQAIEGLSFADILTSPQTARLKANRDYVLVGKERHDVGRPNNEGYPIRGIVKGDYLYLFNFKTDRWPVGNPETGYLNCDGSPTKTVCLNTKYSYNSKYWSLNFGKREAEELYNIRVDKTCINNLAGNPALMKVKNELNCLLFKELKRQNDPRVCGDGDVFDNYKIAPLDYMNYYERYLRGDVGIVNWVNASDYEKK